MATGNISSSGRNYARPTSPTTASAAYSGEDLQVSFTGSTLGPQPTSYLITGTSNDGGSSTTTTVSSSPVNITGTSPSKTYTFQVAGVNYNGAGSSFTTNAITTLSAYVLDSTVNATGNYTIPSSKTKLMAVVVGAGGTGGSGADGAGGAGGSTGGIATIWEFSVTAGTTAAITIGTPGNSTILSYGGTDIATVTSGGTASTNISTNRVLTNGTAGPAGAAAVADNTNGVAGSAGTNVSFSTANLGIGAAKPETPLTFTLSTGGSGASGSSYNNAAGANAAAGSGGTGGTNGGNGGAGGNAYNGNNGTNVGSAGNAASNFGSGGGGGGGGGRNTYWIGGGFVAGGAGGTGGSGRVYIFVK